MAFEMRYLRLKNVTLTAIVAFVLMLFLSSTTSVVEGSRRNGSHLRIHQGKSVSHEKYPYVMVLTMKIIMFIPTSEGIMTSRIITARVCTCSLIKPDWVLLAAHCLRDVKKFGKEFFKIIYGDLTIQPNTTEFQTNIRKFVAHFGFINFLENGLFRNDIALILIDPIERLPLAKISAVDYRSLTGYPVKYLGAGGTYSLASYFNKEQKVISDIDAKDQTRPIQRGNAVVVTCDKKIGLFQTLYPAICLHSKCSNTQQSVMPGDSGGPLLFRDKIVGVASLTGPGTISHVPVFRKDIGHLGSVYTAVSPYLDWINMVISEEKVNCTKTDKTSGAYRRVPKSQTSFTMI